MMAAARARADGATRRVTATIGAIQFSSVQEATAMPDHDIVVVGASAGGVEALAELAASLPANLPAAVFVVLHVPATGTSALPDILSRHGPLPASHVKDGELVERGRIYVAPPDQHVLLRGGHVHLTRGRARTATGPRSTRCSAAPPGSTRPGSSGWSSRAPSTMGRPGCWRSSRVVASRSFRRPGMRCIPGCRATRLSTSVSIMWLRSRRWASYWPSRRERSASCK
jgi:hypothetical protein